VARARADSAAETEPEPDPVTAAVLTRVGEAALSASRRRLEPTLGANA